MTLAQPLLTPVTPRNSNAPSFPSFVTATTRTGVTVETHRAPGRHREPGSTPWRTAFRELAMLLTFGLWVPWRPATMLRTTP